MKKIRLVAKDNTTKEYDTYFNTLRNIYNPMTIYRTKKALKLIEKRQGHVLSIGVGNLAEATIIRDAGFDVTILDISSKAVNYAQDKGFIAYQGDILEHNHYNEKYDYIFCLEVLEHVVNPLKAIGNLREALKSTGLFVISLPNEFNIISRILILFGYPPFGGHDWHHLRFFNSHLGELLLKEAGLTVLKKEYCPRVPLWNKFSRILGEVLIHLNPNLFSYSTIWLLKPIES